MKERWHRIEVRKAGELYVTMEFKLLDSFIDHYRLLHKSYRWREGYTITTKTVMEP